MSKTDETFEVLTKLCEQFKFGSWKIELIFYNGEITGFNQLETPHITFRAKGKTTDKVEDAI